jgi:hypothetical protein
MPNLYMPCRRAKPPKGLTAIWGVACPQGRQLASVFFPLGYPTPYGPDIVPPDRGIQLCLKVLVNGTLPQRSSLQTIEHKGFSLQVSSMIRGTMLEISIID